MDNTPSEAPPYQIIIQPSSGWQMIDWKELLRYKDLLYFLIIRGIKARYAQSVLGIGWAIIQPLFTTLVFTIVFGNLVRVESDGVPYVVFSFTGMLVWNFFSNTLTESANSLITNANMITKVYFPRLVLPLSAAFAKLLDFAIGVLVLIGFLFYYRIIPSREIWMIPLLLIVLLLTSLGMGMFLAALSVQYRDVKHALGFLVQLFMYSVPVVYATSAIPEQWQVWYAFNPIVGVMEGFRAVFLKTIPFPWRWVLQGSILSIVLFGTGALYFRKMERTFADVA